MTSRYRCDALNNWAMKPLMLGAGQLYKDCRNEIKWRMIFTVVNAIYATAYKNSGLQRNYQVSGKMYIDWSTPNTVLSNIYRSYLLLLYWPQLQIRKTRSRCANFLKTAVNTSPKQMSQKRWEKKDKKISILYSTNWHEIENALESIKVVLQLTNRNVSWIVFSSTCS